MNDISLIIPTHFRHHFLRRILDYNQKSGFKIFVVDSSKKAFEDKSKYSNVTYLHFPDTLYFDKMKMAFSRVNTKYSFICADDDFISIESAKKCALFLDKNQDYSSAQGHYISFQYQSSLFPYPTYLSMLNNSISDNSPVSRLNKQFMNYIFHYYAVHRTSFLKYFFEEMNPKFSNTSTNITELANTMASVINGKHRVLPIFYCARDEYTAIPQTQRKEQHFEIIEIKKHDPNYYQNFIIVMADYFVTKHSISKSEAKKELEKILQIHTDIQKSISENTEIESAKPRLIKNLITEMIKNIIPSSYVDKLKKQIYKKKTNGIHGFPFNDKESELQWQEMKKVICRHNIDYAESNKNYFNLWYY